MSVAAKHERAAAGRPWAPQWSPRDNAHFMQAKVDIRRHVLKGVGPRAVVLDAFAGAGSMWQHVWKDAADYVAIDEHWHNDARCAFVADNLRVLRAIDLKPFTIFDLDAYGSPWDQLGIIAARRPLQPGERIGLVLTEGTWLKTRAKDPVRGLRAALPRKLVTPIPYSVHDALITRTLRTLVGDMGGTIGQSWMAIGSTGAKVRYIGVVVDGKAEGSLGAPSPKG
jgi:hypothetical protein